MQPGGWATPLPHLVLGSGAFRAPRPLLSGDDTWAAVKSRDITLHPRPHATRKGEGVPGLRATLAPQTPRVWRTGQRACSALTARAHCAQTSRSELERAPGLSGASLEEDRGLWLWAEGEGSEFPVPGSSRSRCRPPLGGLD